MGYFYSAVEKQGGGDFLRQINICIFFSFGNYPALSYPSKHHCRGDMSLDAGMLYFEYCDPNYVLSPSIYSHTFANRSSDATSY